ncbi:MAG: hypothetical protein GY696_36640 [Gammaproteobacteria bacterium]|nr:hypothetical protein [Gammaproteobacteria bacterium]
MSLLPMLELSDGTLIHTSAEKAEALSREFSANFNDADCDPLELCHPIHNELFLATEDEIFGYIRLLEIDAAVGLDDISPRTIKQCALELSSAIAALLNRCLSEGTFPSVWKCARIVPVPKVPRNKESG